MGPNRAGQVPRNAGGAVWRATKFKRGLGCIERGEINPERVITHTLPLEQAPHGYEIFENKKDNCEKVVLKP
jgi:threonine dehydrogenase-like Zn-dependent dehydrogenase